MVFGAFPKQLKKLLSGNKSSRVTGFNSCHYWRTIWGSQCMCLTGNGEGRSWSFHCLRKCRHSFPQLHKSCCVMSGLRIFFSFSLCSSSFFPAWHSSRNSVAIVISIAVIASAWLGEPAPSEGDALCLHSCTFTEDIRVCSFPWECSIAHHTLNSVEGRIHTFISSVSH